MLKFFFTSNLNLFDAIMVWTISVLATQVSMWFVLLFIPTLFISALVENRYVKMKIRYSNGSIHLSTPTWGKAIKMFWRK